MCARGFTQIPGLDYDETFAPTVSRTALRLVLATAVECNLLIHLVDCKNAFLNGKIDREMYMELPEGFIPPNMTRQSHVWKLKKALYGLKQSPFIWNKELDSALVKVGFRQMKNEPCIYTRCTGKNFHTRQICKSFVILAIYVDDITIAAASTDAMNWAKEQISNLFSIKDNGEAKKIIGLEIKKIPTGIIVHQREYIDGMLDRFNLSNMKTFSIPMENNLKLTGHLPDEPSLNCMYRHRIGGLLFAATL